MIFCKKFQFFCPGSKIRYFAEYSLYIGEPSRFHRIDRETRFYCLQYLFNTAGEQHLQMTLLKKMRRGSKHFTKQVSDAGCVCYEFVQDNMDTALRSVGREAFLILYRFNQRSDWFFSTSPRTTLIIIIIITIKIIIIIISNFYI